MKWFFIHGRISFIIIMIAFVCFDYQVTLAQESISGHNNFQTKDIKILNVGDRVTVELWDDQISYVDPSGKHRVTNLREFDDGRILILDYWATWCGPCIEELPALLGLEEEVDCKVIPLSNESPEKIGKFLANNTQFNNADFFTYTKGRTIDKSFVRESIPHTIVIYNDTIRGITLPPLLNKENLGQLLSRGSYKFTPKINLKKQIVDIVSLENSLIGDKNSKYTVLLPPVAGLVPIFLWQTQFEDGKPRLQITNYSMLSLFIIASGQGRFKNNPNMINVRQGDTIRNVNDEEWKILKTTKFTYEAKCEAGTTFLQAKERLGADLLYYESFRYEIMSLPTKFAILKKTKGKKITKEENVYEMQQVVYYLNTGTNGKVFETDSSSTSELVAFSKPLELMNRDEIEREMVGQEWQISEEIRDQKQLVLSWPKLSVKGAEL